MAEPYVPYRDPVTGTSLAKSLEKTNRSFVDHFNATLDAKRWGGALNDRDQFMEDIGKGWIVEPSWTPEKGQQWWKEKSEGLDAPSADDFPSFADQYSWDEGIRGHIGYPGRAGRFMGRGRVGTPVYIDDGFRGSGLYGSAVDEGFPGALGAFAPRDWQQSPIGGYNYGSTYVRSAPSTGTLGHELGHAKQHRFDDYGYQSSPGDFDITGNFLHPKAMEAANEAVSSYLGRRIIKSKPGWGAAAEDKSWGAYSGLPSYLRNLDEKEFRWFTTMVGNYSWRYPGLKEEVSRVLREYDTLVAPKTINDTSRGDWSEEGLKFMKEWRKSKGLKEVPSGSLQERADEAGPYSMRQGLRGDEVGRAVSSLGQAGGGIASPRMMSRYRSGGRA